jgi:hypothetical protein
MTKKILKALQGLRNMKFTLFSNLFNRTTINNTVNEGGTLNQFILPDEETFKRVVEDVVKQVHIDDMRITIEAQEPEN